MNKTLDFGMPIKPVCDKCGIELEDFGAILFSPPKGKIVSKFHLCKKCYSELTKGFIQ
jgi:hypothetical protein